jgi:uncharacterized protein (TIGR03435 family)
MNNRSCPVQSNWKTTLEMGLNLMLRSTLVVLVLSPVVFGQSAIDPKFDVVSIKPGAFVVGGIAINVEPGRVWCTSCALVSLLSKAYGTPIRRIDGPSWLFGAQSWLQLDSRFPNSQAESIPAMIRQMLEDRFHLVAHVEQRQTRVYALTVEPEGLKIKPSASQDPSQPAARALSRLDTRSGVVRVHGSMTLASLADFLRMDSDVIDETGQNGRFDVNLDAKLPALPRLSASAVLASPLDESDPARLDAPSIFVEIKKLGLRLVPSRAPIDFLVVEQIDRVPTPN